MPVLLIINLYFCYNKIKVDIYLRMGHAVAQSVEALRYNPVVVGSIPDGVIGIFHWHNLSGGIMALGSTQPLTEMSTRNISWG